MGKKHLILGVIVVLLLTFLINIESIGAQENKVGNSLSNLILGGYFVEKDGWIYFSKYTDSLRVTGLYKMKTDGCNIIKLNNDRCASINVIGEWIYYRHDSPPVEGECGEGLANSGELFKVNISGKNRTKICNDLVRDIIVNDDWIYYQNMSDGGKLYKINVDGTKRTKINNDYSIFVNIAGDWIFYQNGAEYWSLYKIKSDGTQKTKLSDRSAGLITVDNNWIYFCNKEDNRKLCKMNFDGSNISKVTNITVGIYNISNGWIYYAKGIGSYGSLYKFNLNGGNDTFLGDTQVGMIINVTENFIFYEKSDGKLYKMKLDGSSKMEVK